MSKHQLLPNQALWFVPSDRRHKPYAVTVEKIGNKWAYLSNRYRINMVGLHADGAGYSSPGRAWLSREEWEAEEQRQLLWGNFRTEVDRSWSAPTGVSADQIKAAARALGFELRPEVVL